MKSGPTPLAALLGAALFLSGCSREEVRSYRIPKETSPQAMAAHTHERPHLHYETPAGWEESEPGRMHLASFVINEGDAQARLTVTPLPGTTGIELEAVNMWRSELGLSPIEDTDLKAQTEAVKIGETDGQMIQFSSAEGDSPRATIGAIATIEGSLWFVKMTGDQAAVSPNKEKLKQFLASLDIHTSSHDSEPAAPAASSTQAGLPTWETPSNWQSKAPGQMVQAAYNVPGEKGQAEVTISTFPNDTGGLGANIDRWRRQVGQGPLDPAQIPSVTTTIEGPQGEITIVDLPGTNPRTGNESRLVAAIVKARNDSWWFYKLLGDTSVVEAEKEKFLKFVQSAEYSHAR